MGSFLESLCTREKETSISHIRKDKGILLLDTLGIFQWIDIPVVPDSPQEIIKEQFSVRRGWEMKNEPLDVQIWIPRGTRTEATPQSHLEFTINSSDLTASDWGYLLGLDIYQDRMGQLLNDAYIKVSSEGWGTTVVKHPPKEQYSLEDLINCIREDHELQASYHSETRRALLQQLMTYKRNPLVQEQGTPLRSFLKPGTLSVVVMNKMPDELRLVVTSILIRKIIAARIDASEGEKHLKVLPKLSREERSKIEVRLAEAIPPSWVALDEAQNILPSERKTSATEMLVKFVREGRNYGLSFMVATQQPASIDQRILAQADTIIAHKLTVQGDIDYVRRNLKSNLPEEVKYANAVLSFDELLRSLDVGQALVSNTETERAFIIDVRPRIGVHGGF